MIMQVLYVLIAVSLACGLPGVFIYYRRQSMVTDAISHSVLLGIVLAYFITGDINSPLLFGGATLFGVITVFLIEALTDSGLVKGEDATGIVFPLFFALAVILITKYAGNVHLDTDMVLMGEVIMTPMNTMKFFGFTVPKKLVEAGVVFLANLFFILIFYKELKLIAFNEEYARLQGIHVPALSYGLMALTSLTAVISFDAVGAILVISFMIAPAAAASLLTKDLKDTIIVTMIYGVVNAVVGFYLGVYFNINISGMVALVGLVTLFLTFLFYPEGPVTETLMRRRRKQGFLEDMLLLHVGNHRDQEDAELEIGVENLAEHLNWSQTRYENTVDALKRKGTLTIDDRNCYALTEKGENRYRVLSKRFGQGG